MPISPARFEIDLGSSLMLVNSKFLPDYKNLLYQESKSYKLWQLMNPSGGEPGHRSHGAENARIGATGWIIIATCLGILIGKYFPEQAKNLKVVSTIFLNLIKCIIVPLLFNTLVVGIAAHTDDL